MNSTRPAIASFLPHPPSIAGGARSFVQEGHSRPKEARLSGPCRGSSWFHQGQDGLVALQDWLFGEVV
jgi:hypothetical protein